MGCVTKFESLKSLYPTKFEIIKNIDYLTYNDSEILSIYYIFRTKLLLKLGFLNLGLTISELSNFVILTFKENYFFKNLKFLKKVIWTNALVNWLEWGTGGTKQKNLTFQTKSLKVFFVIGKVFALNSSKTIFFFYLRWKNVCLEDKKKDFKPFVCISKTSRKDRDEIIETRSGRDHRFGVIIEAQGSNR